MIKKIFKNKNKNVIEYNKDKIDNKILYNNLFLYDVCKELFYNKNLNKTTIKWNFYIQCQNNEKFYIKTYFQWKCIYYKTNKEFIRKINESWNVEEIQNEYYVPYIDPVFFYLMQNHIEPDFDKKSDCLYEINKKRKWIDIQSKKIWNNYIPMITFTKKFNNMYNDINYPNYYEIKQLLFYPFPKHQMLSFFLSKIKECAFQNQNYVHKLIHVEKNNNTTFMMLEEKEYFVVFCYWYVFNYLKFLKQQIREFYDKYFFHFQECNNNEYCIRQCLYFLFSQINKLPQNACGTESIILFQLAIQILQNI